MDYKLKYEKYKKKYNELKNNINIGGERAQLTFYHLKIYILINLCLAFYIEDYKFHLPFQPVIYNIEKSNNTYICHTVRELKPTDLKKYKNYRQLVNNIVRISSDNKEKYESMVLQNITVKDASNNKVISKIYDNIIIEFFKNNTTIYKMDFSDSIDLRNDTEIDNNNLIYEIVNTQDINNTIKKYLYIPYYDIMFSGKIVKDVFNYDNTSDTTVQYSTLITHTQTINNLQNIPDEDLNDNFKEDNSKIIKFTQNKERDDTLNNIKKIVDKLEESISKIGEDYSKDNISGKIDTLTQSISDMHKDIKLIITNTTKKK